MGLRSRPKLLRQHRTPTCNSLLLVGGTNGVSFKTKSLKNVCEEAPTIALEFQYERQLNEGRGAVLVSKPTMRTEREGAEERVYQRHQSNFFGPSTSTMSVGRFWSQEVLAAIKVRGRYGRPLKSERIFSVCDDKLPSGKLRTLSKFPERL